MASFFRVLADPNRPRRWFLGEPRTKEGGIIDARKFTQGTRYDGPAPVTVPVGQQGEVVCFNLAAFDMPIVSESVARIIWSHAAPNVQSFPVTIDRHGFEIINVTANIDCIDEAASQIVKWKPEDGRPDKVGCYRMITNLRINPLACADYSILRIKGWEIALIVSGDIKEAVENVPDLGVMFSSVSG